MKPIDLCNWLIQTYRVRILNLIIINWLYLLVKSTMWTPLLKERCSFFYKVKSKWALHSFSILMSMRATPKWTKTEWLTLPPIPPLQPAAQMLGYQGNWTHSLHPAKLSWSTVFFPLLWEGTKSTLCSGLSQKTRAGPAGSKWSEILLVMNKIKMTWENNHAQVHGALTQCHSS